MSDEKLPFNVLVAYPYIKIELLKVIKKNEKQIRFLLDSGAFTAWKAKKEIHIDDYCRFLETLPVNPWRYFTLDKVGDPKGTIENYQIMLKRGFKPIPVFTRGEDPSVLEDYYKTSDIVGIGGLVGTEKNKGFIKGIMKKVNGRKTHWLGFTNLAFLKAFKPYSADSSTWSMGLRYALLPLYLGNGKPIFQLKKQSIRKQLQNPMIVQAIENYKMNPNDFLKEENWINRPGSHTVRLSVRSMRKMSDDVMKKLGTHFFMACSDEYQINSFLEEY